MKANFLVTNIERIANTEMDFPHYYGLLCLKEEKCIAKIEDVYGNVFEVYIKGDFEVFTLEGEKVKSCYHLKKLLKLGTEVFSQDVCYFEIRGNKGEKEFIGVYDSLGQILNMENIGC